MKTFLTFAVLAATALLARADGLGGVGQNIGGGISQFDNGISYGGTGGFTPPVGCSGTIDGSEGCPLPMLGI